MAPAMFRATDSMAFVSVSTVISLLVVASILVVILVCICGDGKDGDGDKEAKEKHQQRLKEIEAELEEERQKNEQERQRLEQERMEEKAKKGIYGNLSPATMEKKPKPFGEKYARLAWDNATLRLRPEDPYFCEECAIVVFDQICEWIAITLNAPVDDVVKRWHFYRSEWWIKNKCRIAFHPRPKKYDKRSHLVYHEGDGPFIEKPMQEFAQRVREEIREQKFLGKSTKNIVPESTTPLGKKGKGTAVPTETQMRAAQANPAYETIFNAKSGVFDKTGHRKNVGKTMAFEDDDDRIPLKSAHRRNLGKTMAFDDEDGPPVKTAHRKNIGKTMAYDDEDGAAPKAKARRPGLPTESKMRAAQADPAYQTIWNAKSDVFNKGGKGKTMVREGGGGCSVRRKAGAAVPATSTY